MREPVQSYDYTSDAFGHIGQGVRIELGGASPTGDRPVVFLARTPADLSSTVGPMAARSVSPADTLPQSRGGCARDLTDAARSSPRSDS